jgi:hypothetical protein
MAYFSLRHGPHINQIGGGEVDTKRGKQQGGLISLLVCFQNKESGLKFQSSFTENLLHLHYKDRPIYPI